MIFDQQYIRLSLSITIFTKFIHNFTNDIAVNIIKCNAKCRDASQT